MSIRDTLSTALETRIESWEKELQTQQKKAEQAVADAKSEQAEAEVRKEVMDGVNETKQKIDQAKADLAEVKQASEDKLKDMKDSLKSLVG